MEPEAFFGMLLGGIAILSLFIFLPWIILHYVTKWKANASLTAEDENLLDELYELARRLDERMLTIERIMQADNPGWQSLALDPSRPSLDKAGPRDLHGLHAAASDPVRDPAPRRSNQPDFGQRSGGL